MNSGIRYFLATLTIIVLLLVGIVVIVRSGSSNNTNVVPGSGSALTDYTENTNASVQYTIDGPINASENHRAIRITISPRSRQIDVFKGYQGEILDRKTYDNNTDAYGEFLEALNRAGFTKERRLREGITSESICPLANRSFYQIVENGSDVQNLWSAACTDGSFAGNIQLTVILFQAQIPDYDAITRNVSITGTGNRNTGLVL